MNRVLGFLLAAVAVVGLSTAQVLARGGHGGGHHGGGHHGGGHHGGHHSHHSSHSHHHTGHHSHTHRGNHYHHSNWAHHNRPFSHGWYGRHGGAWGYGWGGWGWGNPWAVSTFGATAAWLGLDAVEPYYGNYGTVDNYLTSDETTEPEMDEASNEDSDAGDNATDESESATNETEDNQEENQSTENESAPSPITPEQIAAAKQLIVDGKNDPPKDTAFLPLGVFSLAPEGQHEASAMVQLAVSKAGQVRGTYYDLLTDHDQPIRGAVNKKTQQVAFTFGENGKVTFETSLANLTQETGAVAAHFENGETSTWTLARYSKEPSESQEGEQAPVAQPQSETAVP